MAQTQTLVDENWGYLLSLLPEGWEAMAKQTGAVQRLRGARSVGDLLRVLLLHIGHGCSLRTASVMGKAAGWISMSDVALHRKLTLCEPWLHQLCLGVLKESKMQLPEGPPSLRMRLVDSTLVQEPGLTGSLWRVHYSLSVPEWHCDQFQLSAIKGSGTGDSFKQYTVKAGDCLLADRGFSHLSGLEYLHTNRAQVIVRLNEQNTRLEHQDETPVNLLDWLKALKEPGAVGGLPVWVRTTKKGAAGDRIPARLCAVRKSLEATVLAQRKLRVRVRRKGGTLRTKTLEHSAWIVVLTTVPESRLKDDEVLQWYRVRWQIELAFKRLKSLSDVGHIPKSDDKSSRAWVYGKLLIALLTEKMQRHAANLSPWGGRWLDQDPPPEQLA